METWWPRLYPPLLTLSSLSLQLTFPRRLCSQPASYYYLWPPPSGQSSWPRCRPFRNSWGRHPVGSWYSYHRRYCHSSPSQYHACLIQSVSHVYCLTFRLISFTSPPGFALALRPNASVGMRLSVHLVHLPYTTYYKPMMYYKPTPIFSSKFLYRYRTLIYGNSQYVL